MDSSKISENTERPSWLTDDYITEVLCKSDNDYKILLDDTDITFPLGKGENYTSVILKLIATYHDDNGHQVKKSFIIKSIPQIPVTQRLLKKSGYFDKEINAYSKLFPAMASLTDTPLVSAQFYPTGRDDALILEDMSSRGFKLADRKKRLDLAHSFVALKVLARFHGLSYAVVEREPAITCHFPESMYSDRLKEANSHFTRNMYSSLASVIETWPGYERFAERIRIRIDDMFDQMIEIISPKNNAFNVMNHGDYWVNNMLFRYNEDTQEPEDVCMLDLQIIRYGSPALDLQYFFATSLADGIREEYEDTLLEVYHKELSETVNSVALKPIKYTLEDLKHDLQEKATFGFNMGCFVIAAVVADSSEAIDLDSITEESIADGSVNPMERTFKGKRFREVLQKFLLYNEGKGVI